jgi:hypothetical protein
MTDRRQLIRDASCWAVALSVGMALSTTKSEAQPRGPRGPRWRGDRRWGWGPRRHCWWGPHGRRVPVVVATRTLDSKLQRPI